MGLKIFRRWVLLRTSSARFTKAIMSTTQQGKTLSKLFWIKITQSKDCDTHPVAMHFPLHNPLYMVISWSRYPTIYYLIIKSLFARSRIQRETNQQDFSALTPLKFKIKQLKRGLAKQKLEVKHKTVALENCQGQQENPSWWDTCSKHWEPLMVGDEEKPMTDPWKL